MARNRNRLTEKQRYAIKLLTDFPRKENYEELADRIGVSSATFRRWRNENEAFIKALDERISDLP